MASNSDKSNTRMTTTNQKVAGGTKDTMAKPQQGDSTKPGAPASGNTTVNVNTGNTPAPKVGEVNQSLRNNPQSSNDEADM